MLQHINQKWFCIFLIIQIGVISAQPGNAAKKSLAVLQLSANGVEEVFVREMVDALNIELKNLNVYNLLDFIKIESQLKELGNSDLISCNSATCAIQVGQLLGVDLVAIGGIAIIDKTYSINVRIVEVNNGRIIKDVDEYHNGKDENLIKDIIPVVAAKVSGTSVPKSYSKKSLLKKTIFIGSGVVLFVPIFFIIRKKDDSKEYAPMTEVIVEWN